MAVNLPSKHEPRTLKQRKWVKAYVKTGNANEATRIAYPGISPETVRSLAYDNAKNLDITAIFVKAGLTDYYIARTLKRAMYAKRDNGKPDWLPRLKASEMALKVKGHFKERIEHMGSVGVYPILGGLTKKEDAPMIQGEEVK